MTPLTSTSVLFLPVQVRLTVDKDSGKIHRNAPFMVWGEGKDRHFTVCDSNPEVIRQIAEGEHQARFMGEWNGKRWSIGNRIMD